MGASRTLLGVVDLLRTAWEEAADSCVQSPELRAAGGALGEVLDAAVSALQAAAPIARGGVRGGPRPAPGRTAPPGLSPAAPRLALKRSSTAAGLAGLPPAKPVRATSGPAEAQRAKPAPTLRFSAAASRPPAAAPQGQQPHLCVLPAEMMAALPQEALHDMLAQTITTWLRGRRKRQQGMLEAVGRLADLESSPNVMAIRAHLQPPIPSLQDWILEHMHEERITFSEDADGEVTVHFELRTLTEEEKESRRAAQEAAREQFFQALPADAFTEEELALRDALVGFLQSWRKSEPPMLSMLVQPGTAETNAVAFAKAMLLPRQVPLGKWIQNRIAGDIEMIERAGGSAVRLNV